MIDLKLIFVISPLFSTAVLYSFWIRIFLYLRKNNDKEKIKKYSYKVMWQSLGLLVFALISDIYNANYLYSIKDGIHVDHPETKTLEFIDYFALNSCIHTFSFLGRYVCPSLWKNQESLLRPTKKNFSERLEFCFNNSTWEKKEEVCSYVVDKELINQSLQTREKYFNLQLPVVLKRENCIERSSGLYYIGKKTGFQNRADNHMADECINKGCSNACHLISEDYYSEKHSLKNPSYPFRRNIVIHEGLWSIATANLKSENKAKDNLKKHRKYILGLLPKKEQRRKLKSLVKKFIEEEAPHYKSLIDFSIYD